MKKVPLSRITLTLLCCFSGITESIPATLRPEQRQRLEQILQQYPQSDTNKDGRLSREEFQNFMKARRDRPDGADRQGRGMPPTKADVAYGPHPLQKLDLWLAQPAGRSGPTPLCIYIHGGGFRGGDKKGVSPALVKRFLDRGIYFVSMNYRLTEGGKYPFPVPMHDAARGLQWLRSRAEALGIDGRRVACYGGSAGAGISLWLAFHEDLAEPESPDPVARQSTRLVAAGTLNGQTTYDMRTFREWFGVPGLPANEALIDFYAIRRNETFESPRVVALAEEASAIRHLTQDDPPVFMNYGRPNTPVTRQTDSGIWVHHPLLGLKLQEAMLSLGLECTVQAPGLNQDTGEDLYDFLIRKLSAPVN